jgi:hypothetical protein
MKRYIGALIILAAAGGWIVSLDLGEVGSIDLVRFYVSGEIFTAGGNPYDVQTFAHGMELHGRGAGSDHTTVMYHPPWMYPLLSLLSLLELHTLAAIWLLGSVVIFFVCGRVLWARLGAGRARGVDALLMALFFVTFYPALLNLWLGQLDAPLLLSFVLACLFLQSPSSSARSRFLAGLFLGLTLVKPHLLYLVYLVLAVRAVRTRSYALIAGGVAGFAAMAGAAWLINPSVYPDFAAVLGRMPFYWDTPTLGAWLGKLFGYRLGWLPYLPTLLAALACLWRALREKRPDLGNKDIFILAPLSIFTALYAWVYDFVLFLPALIWLLAFIQRSAPGGRGLKIKFGVLMVLIGSNIAMFLMPHLGMEYYVWYPPLVLALMLGSMRKRAGGAGCQ